MEKPDLTAYTAGANARIRFISDLFPHMNKGLKPIVEYWNPCIFFLLTRS